MSTNITWYGHSNFLISSGGASVLIDPFFTNNPSCGTAWKSVPAPDAVLVTHDHGDHVGDAIAICNATHALCGSVVGTAESLVRQGLNAELVPCGIGFNIGGTIEIKGMRITMTQAFHSSDSGVPAGYIVTMPDGFTFYHAGDTGIFGDMALLGRLYPLRLALLPCGGFFTMDGYQAAEACKLLATSAVIPMHWGTFPVLAQDTTDMNRHLSRVAPACRLVRMAPGTSTTLS